ncbi:MAG: hypothetical protein IT282_17340 [Bacteroidetes bacterium]|nr:hypothetical protein [Bacteroidota bacterium]
MITNFVFIAALLSQSFKVRLVAGSDDVGDGEPIEMAKFLTLTSVATDIVGNVFLADAGGHRIRRVSRGGIVTTIAGQGRSGSTLGTNGQSTLLDGPKGVACDILGNVFIADTGNRRILRVDRSGRIIVLGGRGGSASFTSPTQVLVNPAGQVFILDSGSHSVFRVNEASIDRILGTEVAGTGREGMVGDSFSLRLPSAIGLDTSGAIYVADNGNNRIVRVNPADGRVSTVFSYDGRVPITGIAYADGNILLARNEPGVIQRLSTSLTFKQFKATALAVSAAGEIYWVNRGAFGRITSDEIFLINPGQEYYFRDGVNAYRARISNPQGVATDGSNIYVADSGNRCIRRIGIDNSVSVLLTPGLGVPSGLFWHDQVLYITDIENNVVLARQSDGVTNVVAGKVDQLPAADHEFSLSRPRAVLWDRQNRLWVADSGNDRILVFGGTRPVGIPVPNPVSLATVGEDVYVASLQPSGVFKVSLDLQMSQVGFEMRTPRSVAGGSDGHIYASDQNSIWLLNSSGNWVRIAGTGSIGLSDDSVIGQLASFNGPCGLLWTRTQMGEGLVFSDSGNDRVRALVPISEPQTGAIRVTNLVTGSVLAGSTPNQLVKLANIESLGDVEVLIDGHSSPVFGWGDYKGIVRVPLSPSSQAWNFSLRRAGVLIWEAPVRVLEDALTIIPPIRTEKGAMVSPTAPATRGEAISLLVTGTKDEQLFATVNGQATQIELVRPGIIGGTWEVFARVPSGLWPRGTYMLHLYYKTEATTLDVINLATTQIWIN